MSEQNKMTLFNTFGFRGLELRDYFAAKAMQALIPSGQSIDTMKYAESAYALAEAEERILKISTLLSPRILRLNRMILAASTDALSTLFEFLSRRY